MLKIVREWTLTSSTAHTHDIEVIKERIAVCHDGLTAKKLARTKAVVFRREFMLLSKTNADTQSFV